VNQDLAHEIHDKYRTLSLLVANLSTSNLLLEKVNAFFNIFCCAKIQYRFTSVSIEYLHNSIPPTRSIWYAGEMMMRVNLFPVVDLG
jgi:hypothetical protein